MSEFIADNEEQIFRITFWEQMKGGLHDKYQVQMYFDYLPRQGDLVEIDSCYMRVKEVLISKKNQFEPELIVEHVGDWPTIEKLYAK